VARAKAHARRRFQWQLDTSLQIAMLRKRRDSVIWFMQELCFVFSFWQSKVRLGDC